MTHPSGSPTTGTATTAATTATATATAQTSNGAGAASPAGALVRWLDAAGEADAASVGGKAAPLARLCAAGLPVPPGFVILPHAFPAEQVAGAALTELGEAARAEILSAYEALGARMGSPALAVAVRSSATAEDLQHASFAGQYETFLGVRGGEDVVAHALRCWASLWEPHAVRYRQQAAARLAAAGHELPAPAMAVLVQALVPADAAGVAFTADPVSGDTSAVTLSAAWGLGQSVVDGEVEADTWQVERETRQTIRQSTGDKATRTGPTPGAPREPVPDQMRRRPCLTPEQVAEVVDLALRAEEAIGAPADVEWAIAEGRVWLLQARPITTGAGGLAGAGGANGNGAATRTAAKVGAKGAPSAAPGAQTSGTQSGPVGPSPSFPFEWPREAGDDPAALTRRRQTARGPLGPLHQDVSVARRRTRGNAADITGGADGERVVVLNGHVYAAQTPSPFSETDRQARKAAYERTATALVERGETYLERVIFPELDEANARLGAVDPFKVAPASLADHLLETLRWYERAWTLHWLRPADDPRARFTALLAEVTGTTDQGEEAKREAAAALYAYEPNLMSDAIEGVVALARLVQERAPLRELLLSRAPVEVIPALSGTDGGVTFKEALDALLARQGLRCGEGAGNERDEMAPSWREDPSLVIALVRHYVTQDVSALDQARAATLARRDARVAEVRAGIADAAKREQFDFWLAAARRSLQRFEDHNYKIDSAAAALLRLAIVAAGQRLAAAGRIEREDDVWWLHAAEIALALRGLEELGGPARPEAGGRAEGRQDHPDHWRRRVAAHKALHEWHLQLSAPETLGAPLAGPVGAAGAGGAGGAGRGQSADAAGKAAAPPNALVTGQVGSAGVATGRVRLVERSAVVPEVEEGDVLVARNASPLWAPVFPVAAAVVLDGGGFFQHAMLTCREYGVPAVFQAKDATSRLKEGQRVTVDGTNGWVLPAEPAGATGTADTAGAAGAEGVG